MNYLLFCSPRTGSNVIANIMSQYLITTQGYKYYLDEYLRYSLHANFYYTRTPEGVTQILPYKVPNCWSLYFDYKDGKIQEIRDYTNTYYDNKTGEDILSKHFSLLKEHNDEKYFMKIFGEDLLLQSIVTPELKQEIFNYFNDNYTFICLDRTHKFDQFMSWCVACHTDQWWSPDGNKIKLENNSFRVTRKHLSSFNAHITAYESMLPKLKNKIFYTYEQFIALKNPLDVIPELGFDPIDSLQLKQHAKINTTNAWDYVKNKEEVLEWIKDLNYTSAYDLT